MKEIANMAGFKSQVSILNRLNKHGIERRSTAGVGDSSLIHGYFNEIDTEIKAYLLGFIYADGNIMPRKKSQTAIRMELNKRDKFILELLKKEINTKNTIRDSKKDCVRIAIHSNEMANSLEEYGIVPRKSYSDDPIKIIPEPYMKHFIRGVFDGNGWVYKKIGKNGRRDSIIFGLCGTFKAMDMINRYLRENLELSNVKVNQYGDKIPFFTYGGAKDIKKIYDYLYGDSKIFLERKKNKFEL